MSRTTDPATGPTDGAGRHADPEPHGVPQSATTSAAAYRFARDLEESAGLDRLVALLQGVADTVLPPPGRLLDEVRGASVGHTLHPFLTDLPIGAWTSATVLDLTGPRRHADAARVLVGAGILAAVPTALTGVADWVRLGRPSRRVGAVHAACNGAALGAYAVSWWLRRRGSTGAGVVVGLVGATAASAGGYLGAHLTLVRKEPHDPPHGGGVTAEGA